MKKICNALYSIGVILSILASAGFAEAITGRGDKNISIALLIVGFLLCLFGYVK